jgi:soluble lytic murein transglycosylase
MTPATLAAAVVLGVLPQVQPLAVRSGLTDACVARPVAQLDSALANGQWWHAFRLTRPLPARPVGQPAATVLVPARIAAGLGRWDAVDSLLRRARGGDSLPAFVELAARADEQGERWAAAVDKYRRLRRLPRVDEPTRAAATVRLALNYERLGRLDSASAVWRRAAQALPEIADWLALRRADHERDTLLAFAALAGMRSPAAERRAAVVLAERRLRAGNRDGALEIYRRLAQPLDVARVEFLMGQRRTARARADTLLFADPTRPVGLLAATFLTSRFDSLSQAEYLAVSRAYRARGDLRSAERWAVAATRTGRDTSVGAWIELSTVLSLRRNHPAARRAVDSAAARAGTRRAALIGAARVRALLAADQADPADSLLARLVRVHAPDTGLARVMVLFAGRNRARGQLLEEMRRYGELLRRFPDAPATNLARFRLGLVFYAADALDTARVLLAEAAARDTARVLGVAPQFWQARVRAATGDSSAAADLRRIAVAMPVTYYGVRARELLGESEALLVDTALSPPRPGSFPPARARERIRLLAGVGFETDARAEAAGWLSDTSVTVHVLIAAAQAAADAGYAREAIWLGEAARQRAGMLPAIARVLFPIPYETIIRGEADEHCVDPLLLAAIIRQESRFDPRAVSSVGARGMSQVMPATGRELAERLRIRDWHPDLLFVPDHNLHLGSRYLSERLGRDSFPVHAAVASYNAGPTRVRSWRRWLEFGDPDLFAERVAINETHDYVKVVYMSYLWYRRLYAPPSPAGEPAPPRPLAPYP